MLPIIKNEWKSSRKSLMIWALAVGGMGFICILLFKSMENNIAEMAENFADMGAFSEAFGMNTLSIATVAGYFATEIGTIHALGGSMFAATIATVILSKEEDAHTAEFTFTLPVTRTKVIAAKYASVLINLMLFTVICTAFYLLGFVCLGEKEIPQEFFLYMCLQLMMNMEIASICFLISAVNKKNKLGIGISLALVCYIFDLMARVIPDLDRFKLISPFSYANASEIFSKCDWNLAACIWGIICILGFTGVAGVIYAKRDLAS